MEVSFSKLYFSLLFIHSKSASSAVLRCCCDESRCERDYDKTTFVRLQLCPAVPSIINITVPLPAVTIPLFYSNADVVECAECQNICTKEIYAYWDIWGLCVISIKVDGSVIRSYVNSLIWPESWASRAKPNEVFRVYF